MRAIPTTTRARCRARRAAIVSTAGLARLAGRIELGRYLLLGEGESQRSGRRRPSLLASSFEALTGALYLDLGYDRVRRWLLELAEPELSLEAPVLSLKSPKSRLQEYTQRRTGERPEYRLVEAGAGPREAVPGRGLDRRRGARVRRGAVAPDGRDACRCAGDRATARRTCRRTCDTFGRYGRSGGEEWREPRQRQRRPA